MKDAKELRELRRKWVGGPPPVSKKAAVAAQLVIHGLIEDCFAYRRLIRKYPCIRMEKELNRVNDKYEDAFNEIVMAVARILFGDSYATNASYQRVVRVALLQVGVWDIIKGLGDN